MAHPPDVQDRGLFGRVNPQGVRGSLPLTRPQRAANARVREPVVEAERVVQVAVPSSIFVALTQPDEQTLRVDELFDWHSKSATTKEAAGTAVSKHELPSLQPRWGPLVRDVERGAEEANER